MSQARDEKDFLVRLGHMLLVRRVRADLTQQQLADATGLTRNKISALERGEQSGRLLDFIALARYFRVTLDELVKNDGVPPYN